MAELPANPIERARMVAQLGLLEVGVGELDVLIADAEQRLEVLHSKRSEAVAAIAAYMGQLGLQAF
jgi:hypothetical protein